MTAFIRLVTALTMLWVSAESSMAAGDAVRGDKLFHGKAFCWACHETGKDGYDKVGPLLYNLFGTVAGTKPGYRFSDAMSKSGLLWADDTLEAHIINPQALIPGTKMPKPPALERQERLDIISYLRKVTAIGSTEGVDTKSNHPYFDWPISRILNHYCGGCHDHSTTLSANQLSGTLLETYEEVMRNGHGGPIVVPGSVSESRLMGFLDGTRHFVSVEPGEAALIGKWIEGGAKQGTPTSSRVMEVPQVSKEQLRHIYCHFGKDIGFAKIDVVEPSGQVIFSDWAQSDIDPWLFPERALLDDDKGEWARWSPADGNMQSFPERVSVRLTLFARNSGQFPNLEDAPIFVIGKNSIEDAVLKTYSSLFRFEHNPVDGGLPQYGTFFFTLGVASNVEIKIYPSIEGATEFTSLKEKSVPAGDRFITWMRNAPELKSGDFTASLRFVPVSPGNEQPQFAALVHVR